MLLSWIRTSLLTILFLGGLYVCLQAFVLEMFMIQPWDPTWTIHARRPAWQIWGLSLGFNGIFAGLLVWLLRGQLWAGVRYRLAPLWQPAVLAWLIPATALLIEGGSRGVRRIGLPLPITTGGYEEPWYVVVRESRDHVLIFLAVLAAAWILCRIVPRARRPARFLVLAVFSGLVVDAAHDTIVYFTWGSTWEPGEIRDELVLPYLWIFALYLALALIPAGRMVRDLLDWRPSPLAPRAKVN